MFQNNNDSCNSIEQKKLRLILTDFFAARQLKKEKNEQIVFLGRWCQQSEKRYQSHPGESVQFMPFHWDDREKLGRDLTYIVSLHARLLSALSAHLNATNKVNYDNRYWQILLDPWLIYYIGTHFDRWESIRIASTLYEGATVDIIEIELDTKAKTRSWLDFAIRAGNEEHLNQLIYQRILQEFFQDKFKLNYISGLAPSERYVSNKPNLRYTLKVFFRKLIYRFFYKKIYAKVFFIDSYFNLKALKKLSKKLEQKHIRYTNFIFEKINNKIDKKNIEIKTERDVLDFFEHESPFESLLAKWIVKDIPDFILDTYHLYQREIRSLNIHCDIIFTANAHYHNSAFKHWTAFKVTQEKAKLIVSDHGGSFPMKKFSSFEDAIADVRVTWYRAEVTNAAKSAQLSPNKLVEKERSTLMEIREIITVVGYEDPRYVVSANFFSPFSHQCVRTYDIVFSLYQRLSPTLQDVFRIKPYPNLGWNLGEKFKQNIGQEKIISGKSLDEVILNSRLVICTYPQTTFGEAMYSGVPTLLLYPADIFETDPRYDDLLHEMMAAKIIFTDSEAMALHVQRIWDNLEEWWGSADIVKIREKFAREAQNMHEDWVQEWSEFFERTWK